MSTTTGRREFLRAAAVTSAGLALAKLLPAAPAKSVLRSEEHTSELQSRLHLVCRLLLEKKKKTTKSAKATGVLPSARQQGVRLERETGGDLPRGHDTLAAAAEPQTLAVLCTPLSRHGSR